jgi:hypothetical protein
MAMCASASRAWRFWGVVLLLLLLSGRAFGASDDFLHTDVLGAEPLRLPVRQWVRLLVDIEEYYPVVEYADRSSSTTRSLAILPSIRVTAPDQHFQPYIGAGLGLGISGYTPSTATVPLPLGTEESLIWHIGGGIEYHLRPGFSLTGSARYAQFRTTDLLSSSLPVIRDGLDFDVYTVELGIRLAY